ncbi:glycosyltransferase [Bacillus solitudinis]|uniref:glycosyltransferase n=1 Tax=Bacillus solitudinis TaxID=2014074 RepID=UPI000C231C32|nr:glycosyltransferase [Bacillus solitudinis]
MKILLACYKSFPRFGGTSEYMNQLYKKLTKLGHQVDILAHKPGMNEIYLGEQSIQKKPIKDQVESRLNQMYREKYPHFSSWMLWREIECYTYRFAAQKFDLSGYDIIHAQDIISARGLRGVCGSVPLVGTFHNCKTKEWYTSGEYKRKTELELQFIANEELTSALSVDHLIIPCNWLKSALSRLGKLTTDISIFPYGIDIDYFYQRSSEPTLMKREQRLVISCPARLVPIKGHTYLLSALQTLKKRRRSFICWIIGEGFLMESLQKKAKDLGLESNVVFLGGRNDVPSLLKQSDIVVLPTIHDTLPFTVMEGQLAGKPVVASDVGGVSEMIENRKTGLLVKPKDSNTLADCLDELLGSERLRIELGALARDWAQIRWSNDDMIRKTLDVYQKTQEKRIIKEIKTNNRFPDMDFLRTMEGCDSSTANLNNSESSISGSVVNGVNKPVKHAAVHLIDHSNIVLRSTFSDVLGRFMFTEIPIGKYSIMIWKEGYHQPNSINVELERGQINNLSMRLI